MIKITNKILLTIILLFWLTFNLNIVSYANNTDNKYPDYASEFVGVDKFEKFNRKMFNFNSKLNKFVIKPVHIIWASVMPKYGMERIESIHNNIVYPRRLVSCILQKDFKSVKNETLRFLTNSTLGLAGMLDPAKSLFDLHPVSADMETALTNCKVKQGPYLIMPVMSATSPRAILGKILDWGLDPSTYIGTPILAAVKAGIMVNRTSYMQPIIKRIESNYADPYDITKKLYGVERHIKAQRLDRNEILGTYAELYEQKDNQNFVIENIDENNLVENSKPNENAEISAENLVDNNQNNDNNEKLVLNPQRKFDFNLEPDILLSDYNSQHPVTDAMRTALFDLPEINDSIWSELSIWNRCFNKKVKTSSVNIYPKRDNYKFKYIMQKDKSAPIVIIYPSIGEGVNSYHSVVLAKLFFDEGYSAIIQGNHFHWEFVKSMPLGYKPGIPFKDAIEIKHTTGKIIHKLEEKYECKFKDKIVIGTSLGAMSALFLAELETKQNNLNISKYIAISPPLDLMYAMNQIDKYNQEWKKDSSDLKDRVAYIAAKILKIYENKDSFAKQKNIELPFSSHEAKLITGFILQQKLADLIFTIENIQNSQKSEFNKLVSNMNYNDYAKKYLFNEQADIDYNTSIFSIENYLKNNDNYLIYHSIDDYFVNKKQLHKLKEIAQNKVVFLSNGFHLGFLYRNEFIKNLKQNISQKYKIAQYSLNYALK